VDLVKDGQAFHSHGTSVASLIAGQNPQAPGVAPATSILDVRVADPEGFTVSSVLSQGVIEAVDRGAKVLNISFGGTGDSDVLRAALDYAWKKGAVVVAAAGNEGVDQLAYPAAYEGVLSVGSVDAKGKQASFSNSGEGLDLVAPGVGVVTAWETDKVAITSGTSHSTGLVSGSAAAYLAWGVPSQDVIRLLKSHAKRTGAPSQRLGAGILNIRENAR
jgi:thermitase